MFENVGGKIKGLAKVLVWAEAILVILTGLILIEDTDGRSILFAIGSVPVVWISNWFLYGFGEIIDKLRDIERNTRCGERKSEMQARVDDERISKIEKLRSQGLITEEEYQRAISKE